MIGLELGRPLAEYGQSQEAALGYYLDAWNNWGADQIATEYAVELLGREYEFLPYVIRESVNWSGLQMKWELADLFQKLFYRIDRSLAIQKMRNCL